MLLREKLVRAELAAARLGIHEVGGNNHGPWVKKFLAEVGLPEGYAWCDAFQSFEEHQVAEHRLPIESASVAQTYNLARQQGWIVTVPARGDLGCVNWDRPGPPFGDHIVLVVKATSFGPSWLLKTVEGNTSSGGAGSQGDGDGVFVRTRVISKKQIGFVRIPGVIADPPAPAPKPKPKPARQPILRKGSTGAAVRTLQRLLRRHGATVAVDGIFGPRTETSVRAFQKRASLHVDGVVGPKTWARLKKAA